MQTLGIIEKHMSICKDSNCPCKIQIKEHEDDIN